jgi:hypothetical protein
MNDTTNLFQLPNPEQLTFEQVILKWHGELGEWDRESHWPSACMKVARETAKAVIAWCVTHDETPQQLHSKLTWEEPNVINFVQGLYYALHLNDKPPSFWSHVDLQDIYLNKSSSYRNEFVDIAVKDHAHFYIAHPWLHTPYLDWVFIDSMIAAEAISTYEYFQLRQIGFSHALFDGNPIKSALFHALIVKPLGFAVNWIAPAGVCWWMYGSSAFTVTAIVTALYYLYMIVARLYGLSLSLARKFRGEKTQAQKFEEMLLAFHDAYHAVSEPTVHMPTLLQAVARAREVGVVWAPQQLCILENIAKANPVTWQISRS